MRLKSIIQELIDRRFNTQTALAEALNPMPDSISRVKPADIQRLAAAGRNQEKQFAMFMKLLPFCIEAGLISAHELLPRKTHVERSTNLEASKASKAKAHTR